MPLSHDDVRNAYRFVLGRLPEDEHALIYNSNHECVEDLRRSLLSSTEFRDQGFLPPSKAFSAYDPPEAIEIECSEAGIKDMISRTGQYWSEIGKSAPHYSVVTDDKFTPTQFSENEGAFWESGENDRDNILALLRRIGRSASEFRCCVEYGCGVGRMTVPLSATFPKVIALDVSPSHLEIAQSYVKPHEGKNVYFLPITSEEVMPALDYDLWLSRYVLQHNPAPVTLAILDKAFSALSQNGVAILQVPTYCEGYIFKTSEYLANNGQYSEIHVTPQKAILDLAFRHQCCLREVHEEPGHRIYIMNIFVFQKMMR
jgi:hypothetical protein